MAPKRKAAASAAARKRKAPPSDWRTPIFYWRGAISGAEWTGTWVASAAGLPRDAEFKESANTFSLRCSQPIMSLVDEEDREVKTAHFTGSYKLDNGEGLADYEDVEHSIAVCFGPEWASVAARGTTEFGDFVSLGKLHDGASQGGYQTLTLARRYIADGDPRTAMNATSVLARVEAEDSFAGEHPWLALPWKVPSSWPAPLPVPEGLYETTAHADTVQ
mmetsp:Transcript_50075/g.165820  ORF Transcript_50075/g.165820 Transcript_50075/m.165820 type:complete len:219 (+) Transcript_50075:120-776(+)|eukprot:CAMPEP_0202802562 /NCGR_PEP_ID=MMETSP1388-20130828/102700_1 /ASSEMBLY_ACC=CAM_ASM_000864 /TAXON_ID=37098 /ORGANISM="Isochrysis sp, Strain CCMP1244" /LENGTH=218 /DNA_ID=CAMNT_0049472553 /DNA_START=74 /DNA_END=730 /DNA_ORIENTATION=-